MSERLGLHLLHDPAAEARSAKVQVTVPAPRSARRRPRAERARLEAAADSIGMVALRGDLDFAAAELALVEAHRISAEWLVIDLLGITRLHTVADRLLHALPDELSATVAVVRDGAFPTLDAALEWCEEQVLGERRPAALAEHDLLAEFDPDDARAR